MTTAATATFNVLRKEGQEIDSFCPSFGENGDTHGATLVTLPGNKKPGDGVEFKIPKNGDASVRLPGSADAASTRDGDLIFTCQPNTEVVFVSNNQCTVSVILTESNSG